MCVSYIASAVTVASIAVLMDVAVRCCCRPRDYHPYSERNSRLAMLLMLLLGDRYNQKYIRMAKQIGYDHIVNDDSVFECDTASDEE